MKRQLVSPPRERRGNQGRCVLDGRPSLELNDENAVISTPASRFELVAAKNPYLLNRLALSLKLEIGS